MLLQLRNLEIRFLSWLVSSSKGFQVYFHSFLPAVNLAYDKGTSTLVMVIDIQVYTTNSESGFLSEFIPPRNWLSFARRDLLDPKRKKLLIFVPCC